jgi:hypothetical protein
VNKLADAGRYDIHHQYEVVLSGGKREMFLKHFTVDNQAALVLSFND